MIGRIVSGVTRGGVRRILGTLLVVAVGLAVAADAVLGTNLVGWATALALVLVVLALAVGHAVRTRVDDAGLLSLGPIGDVVNGAAGLVTSVGKGLERVTEFLFE